MQFNVLYLHQCNALADIDLIILMPNACMYMYRGGGRVGTAIAVSARKILITPPDC